MIRSHQQARRATVAIVLGLVALASGCNKNQTAPTPELITDTFTGVVNVLGKDSKTFNVKYTAATSDASVTVTSLRLVSDNSSITPTIGVGFGAFAFDGSCQLAAGYIATAATINQELLARGIFSAGGFCVQIFDSGTLTEPTNYTMVVKHY